MDVQAMYDRAFTQIVNANFRLADSDEMLLRATAFPDSPTKYESDDRM